MTDPRLDPCLLATIRRLPKGSGVIFRHYGLTINDRRTLFGVVRRVCRQRGHVLLLAGDASLARRWKADGAHGRDRAGFISAPVHNAREIEEAKRNGAQILLLSPLHSTRSHPGAPPLRPAHFRQLALLCHPARVIALGGMTRSEASKWSRKIVHGWAAIDAFKL